MTFPTPSTTSWNTARPHQAFKPVEGEQYEAGIKYQPTDSSLLTLSVFQIKQKNVLTGDIEYPEYQLQEGEVRSRGIEFEGKARVGQIELIGALSYLDSFYTKSNYGDEGNRNETQAPLAGSEWVDYHFASDAYGHTTKPNVGAGKPGSHRFLQCLGYSNQKSTVAENFATRGSPWLK